MSVHTALFHSTAGLFQVPFISPGAAAYFCFHSTIFPELWKGLCTAALMKRKAAEDTQGFTEVAPALL